MDNRQIQALENLRNLCWLLYESRKENKPWPFSRPDDPSPQKRGPTEEQAELMMDIYVSNIDPNERQNNPNLRDSNSPEYALEVFNKIRAFLEDYANKLDQIDEADPKLKPNLIGPAVMEAYEKHLEELELRKQARGSGKRIRIISLDEQIEKYLEIRLENIRQQALFKEIEEARQKTANQLQPIIEASLKDVSFFSSLSPDQKQKLIDEASSLMVTDPEVDEVKKFIQIKLASGISIFTLSQQFNQGQLPATEEVVFKRFLNYIENSKRPPRPVVKPIVAKKAVERVTDLLQAKYQVSQSEVNTYINKLRETSTQYENILLPAVTLQTLSVLALSPDINRLVYLYQAPSEAKLKTDSLPVEEPIIFSVSNFLTGQGIPLQESEFLAQRFYLKLYHSYLRHDKEELVSYPHQKTINFLANELKDFSEKDPFLKRWGLNPNRLFASLENSLTKDPVLIFQLRQAVNNHYSARRSPNHLPLKQLLRMQFNEEWILGRLRSNPFFDQQETYRSFFGHLTPQYRLLIVGVAPNKLDSILDDIATKSLIIKAIRTPSFDPLQAEKAVEIVNFLKEHPTFHNLTRWFAVIKSNPVLAGAVSVLMDDPSNVFLFAQQVAKYEIYNYKEVQLKYFLRDKYLNSFLGKIPILNLLWERDQYGGLHFALTDPKKWASVFVKRRVKKWIYKQFHYGFIKKFIIKPLAKLFWKFLGKASAKVFLKVSAQVVGALLGISLGPVGWIGTAILAYSLLRDIFPWLKKLETVLLAGIALLFYGSIKIWLSIFQALGGLLSGAVGAFSSILTTLTSGVGLAVSAPVTVIGAGLGGVAAVAMFTNLVTYSSFVDYQKGYAPIFYASCSVKDIHKTEVITPENKANFLTKFAEAYPDLNEQKLETVIQKAKSLNFNPALAVAIWGVENQFGDTHPCFPDQKPECKANCFSKGDFTSFIACYGPADEKERPVFISNLLVFYRQLVPTGADAVVCPGGTTGQFASQLLNFLIGCYGNIVNQQSVASNSKGIGCLSEALSSLGNINIAAVVGQVKGSIDGNEALQCVGFAKAVEAGTGGPASFINAPGHAINLYQEFPGYQLIPKSQNNVMVGDLAFFAGTYGHVGVVVKVDGEGESSQFVIAQAIGLAPDGSPYGLINESGPIHISWPTLLGFLRRK